MAEIVSIHALTRSATYRTISTKPEAKFQSMHSRGVRLYRMRKINWMLRFQSTHSRGVRPAAAHTAHATERFQSTHSRGVRRLLGRGPAGVAGFQSTHSRGVRQCSYHRCAMWGRFNPRTHEECDFFDSKIYLICRVSSLTFPI